MKVGDVRKDEANGLAARLKTGAVAVVPTDTVYGLVCDAFHEEAKTRIYELKGRPRAKSLIGFVAGIEQAGEFAEIPPEYFSLVARSWPGPVTFIFKSRRELSFLVSEQGGIALRVPNHPFLLDLLPRTGLLASTSANPSGGVPPDSIAGLAAEIVEGADIVIDGGTVSGRESVIWNCTGELPRLVRGTVLFLCGKNAGRSSPAAAMLHRMVEGKNVNVREESDDAAAREAALIVVPDEEQRKRIAGLFPESADRIIRLDIPDPAGTEVASREIRDAMQEKIETVILRRIMP